jgi:hypothetical protein
MIGQGIGFTGMEASWTQGLFVWGVCGWLCRENCCAEKAVVQEKLLF